jgi:hypothetical protein
MYAFRELHTEPERREYLDSFCAQLARRSGGALELTIPTSRIERCTGVVGVFNRAGEMVAGYIVNPGPHFILLSVIPAEAREAWLGRVPLHDQVELNLIWRGAKISHTTFAMVVWPRIIWDCVTCGRARILGSGYENPLNRWYQILRPERIYDGPSTTSGLQVYVYAYTRAKIAGTYFASLADNLLRRRGGPRG